MPKMIQTFRQRLLHAPPGDLINVLTLNWVKKGLEKKLKMREFSHEIPYGYVHIWEVNKLQLLLIGRLW